MISADAESCKVELITEYDLKDLPSLRVDETRFQQVLPNLLSNAIKYNIPDGRVVLNCKTMAGGMVRISVSDTGRGIPADQKDRVFEAFKKLDTDNSDTPGNGIGLSIARQLTESIGGVLGFESTVDVGSTFWVELPSANRMLH